MISTVTTATVTTVYSTAGIGLLATLLLLAFLVQKELASTSEEEWLKALSRSLNMAIVPLLLAFAFIIAVKVIEILR